MNPIHRLLRLLRRSQLDRDMNEEMQDHLDRETAQNIARGLPPDEARYAALRAFGGVEQIKERARDARPLVWFSQLRQDLRYALRMLRRDPGFTATVVLTLALGLGACTTVFSVVNGILLRPLPYPQSEQLVSLWEDASGKGTGWNIVAGAQFSDWREQLTTLEAISAVRRVRMNLTGSGQPEQLNVHLVSAAYLNILRLRPQLGRDFLPDDDQPGRGQVVILSHRFWQRYFGGATDIVDRTIQLGVGSYTVVGILPPAPELPYTCDALVPFVFGSEPWHRTRGDHRLRVIGRIKPGLTVEQVQAELNAVTDRLRPSYPSWKHHWGALAAPLHGQMTTAVRPQLWVLFGAVGCVLLIACANIAGLLLARMAARAREIALRGALGASRSRLVRQLLVESLLLSVTGGALGALLSFWGVDLLTRLAANGLPVMQEVRVDAATLGFALGASLVTGLLFGLAPLVHLARLDPHRVLNRQVGLFHAPSAGRLRSGIIVAQVALALVLLTGAGLLLATLWRLHSVPAGFDARQVLALDLTVDTAKYPPGDRGAAFAQQILQRLARLPGVEAAGSTTSLPMAGFSDTAVRAASQPERDESYVGTDRSLISGNYFAVLRIPLLQGRLFTAGDEAADAPRRAILSATLARQLFPDAEPVGQSVRMQGQTYEVIGVVGDVRQRGLDRAIKEHLYTPRTLDWGGGTLVVRTSLPPASVAEACRQEILRLDRNQPVANVRTLEQIVGDSTAERRVMFGLLSTFALASVVLVAIGLYGLVAYAVTQRTREIGIRMALGASSRAVLRSFLREGLALALFGVGGGLLAALACTRLLGNLLFGVAPTDPVVLLSVSAVLVLVALGAAWLPARRATRVDPATALRAE